jgi:chaperonin GroES
MDSLCFCHIDRQNVMLENVAYFLQILFRKVKLSNKNQTIMNIKPLADRVLILPAPAEEKTIGGIIIPDTAKEKPLQGEIIATGEGSKDEEMVLKVGDQVLYGKYAGTELEYQGVKYLIMRQSDVLAVLG